MCATFLLSCSHLRFQTLQWNGIKVYSFLIINLIKISSRYISFSKFQRDMEINSLIVMNRQYLSGKLVVGWFWMKCWIIIKDFHLVWHHLFQWRSHDWWGTMVQLLPTSTYHLQPLVHHNPSEERRRYCSLNPTRWYFCRGIQPSVDCCGSLRMSHWCTTLLPSCTIYLAQKYGEVALFVDDLTTFPPPIWDFFNFGSL